MAQLNEYVLRKRDDEIARLENIEVYPFYRTDKANSTLWKWLERTNKNHINLVESGLICDVDNKLYMKDWKEKSENKISFVQLLH